MLIQYAYIKSRSDFGKQCVFGDSGPIAEENVLPEPKRTRDYVYRRHCPRGVQQSAQLAAHEVQTKLADTKNTGVCHTEGGWPREINPKDVEAVERYRRRTERSDSWASNTKSIMTSMEYCIGQNNAVNIYENYFDDMIPTSLVMRYEIRTANMYEDPGEHVRPVSHLSWSAGRPNRLAASYSFMEFEDSPANVDPRSYIWDIENPNIALMTLRSSLPLMSVEFNPRDPSMLTSGLLSGQVCTWDMRTGNKPVQVSHLLFGHRHPASQVLWITSKTNTEFFSSSTSGTIKWWDIRNLRKPTETLVMDLEEPTRADIVRAIGVSALQFEPTMGSRFMAGTENGIVVNVNRKSVNVTEKLVSRINCYTGPVLAVDRNPFSTKHFLTVGDWSAKIWADDTREGSLIATCEEDTSLSGGCWSRSRYSVFFTIDTKGVLAVYDILTGICKPLTTCCICDRSLTAIAAHEDGKLLAVGGHNGNIYLVECSDGLMINSKNDKAVLINYLERCSRFEKVVDNRLKEMRLLYGTVHEESVRKRVSKSKAAEKRDSRRKSKEKITENTKEKTEQPKKKSRARKIGKDSLYFTDDVELIDAEVEYFRAVESESSNLTNLEDIRSYGSSSAREVSEKKRKQIEQQAAKGEPKKERRAARDKVKSKRPRSSLNSLEKSKEVPEEEEIGVEIDTKTLKGRGRAGERGAGRILRKSCTAVCEPEICCMDMEGARKGPQRRRSVSEARPDETSKDASFVSPRSTLTRNEKWQRKFSDLVENVPERSPAQKRRMMIEKDRPPDVLRDEVEEACRALRLWQEGLISRGNISRARFRKSADNESPGKLDKKVTVDEKEEKPQIEPNEREVGGDMREKERQTAAKNESDGQEAGDKSGANDNVTLSRRKQRDCGDYKTGGDRLRKTTKKKLEKMRNVSFLGE